jgi:putative transposase
VQSHEEISDGESFGNRLKGFFQVRQDAGRSKFSLARWLRTFRCSPSNFEPVRKYILDQEEHHKKETFLDEYLRILKKCGVRYDERYLWD